MYAVKQPKGPDQLVTQGQERMHCSLLYYNSRLTRPWLGRPGTLGGCRPDPVQVNLVDYGYLVERDLLTLIWMGFAGILATFFGLIWLYVRVFWANVLHGYSGCIGVQLNSILNGMGQRDTFLYIYARRYFIRVPWTLIPFVDWVGCTMFRD